MRWLRSGLVAGALLLGSIPAGQPAFAHHGHVFMGGGFYWGPGPWWGWYGPPAYSGYPGYYGYPVPNAAAVDTDVSPEEAVVLLDGENVGTADDYDGFPDYLYVPPGRHVIEFRADGFKTLRVTLHAQVGFKYQVKRKLHVLEKGAEDKAPASLTAPDEEEMGNPPRPAEPPPEPAGPSTPPAAEESTAPAPDRPGETPPEKSGVEVVAPPGDAHSATLILRLRPDDAAVYLDGKLLGAGESVLNPDGIPVDPGRHTLDVVKPGFRPWRSTLLLEAGDRRTITVKLVAFPGD